MNKINITPYSIEDIEKYNAEEKIGAFIVGNNKFGLRQIKNFTTEEIGQICKLSNKPVLVAVNKLMHKADLEELATYLKELEKCGVSGVIFGDFAVLMLIREHDIKLDTYYNTETTITNQYFTEFAADQGITGVELAKEITLKEIKEIAENKKTPISINIHSHIYMYQSIRKLITNYGEVQEQKYDNDREYYLFDEEREAYYPLVENEQGTHLLASNDVCMINHLDKIIGTEIDYLKIDGFGYKHSDYLAIVDLYLAAIEAINNNTYAENKKEYLETIKNLVPHKKMGTGFYFKKTIF